jgi:hypothetical protein
VKSHTVSVTIASGSIQVRPDSLVMTTDDEVQWVEGGGQGFSIEFDGDGPFASRKLSHAIATARQKPRAKGRFKYTVISDADPTLRLDPEIVIDPPPTEHP